MKRKNNSGLMRHILQMLSILAVLVLIFVYYYVYGFEPFIYGLAIAALAVVVVSMGDA